MSPQAGNIEYANQALNANQPLRSVYLAQGLAGLFGNNNNSNNTNANTQSSTSDNQNAWGLNTTQPTGGYKFSWQ